MSCQKKDAEQLLKWYESDLGKKITSAEASSSSSDAYDKILASEAQLLANTDRLALQSDLMSCWVQLT